MKLPVVVLSNNDGCIVSRSNEVKALNIKMGTPIYKIKDIAKKYNIQIFSSNYALYADMSSRVMNVLSDFAPEIEIYSIDEAFLSLDKFVNKDLSKYCDKIKKTIYKWTGIPVSIGIGHTKTLAKIANRIAKKKIRGIFNLISVENIDKYLEGIQVSNVWGVGYKYSRMLVKNRIFTALDLKNTEEKWIEKKMTVLGLKTVLELNNIPCIDMELVPPDKKGVTCSRSFGKPVKNIEFLEEAVSDYITIACEKIRKGKLIPQSLTVYLTTNRFNQKDKQYANWSSVKLKQPTIYTPEIISIAKIELNKIYKKGFKYKKVGVLFSGLIPKDIGPGLFYTKERFEQNNKLMETVDKINLQWGKDTVKFLSSGINKKWQMRRTKLSKSFTTKWDEIPVVYCD